MKMHMDVTGVPEIAAAELAAALDAGDRIQLLDIRSPAKVSGGRIITMHEEDFHNIPGSSLLSVRTLAEIPVNLTTPTVVVCSHGNDSKIVTALLNGLGARVKSLAGGMSAWMMVSRPRHLDPPVSLDQFVQFDRPGKGALSYVLISSGDAVIVDPAREFRSSLAFIEGAGARLVAVADTHVHADYISGAGRLSREVRVPYYLHPADAVYPYDDTPGTLDISPLRDGMEISFGRCKMTAVHTPGHSPGSVSFLIDRRAALTGDFLFIASVGRPDLAAKTEAWSALLWQSIQKAKRDWPHDIMIYPAHYGTQAERRADLSIGAPLADLLGRNASLGKTSETEFMSWVRQQETTFPDAYRKIKAVNVGLSAVGEDEADELEFGKNECAIG
jgi:glyoxylase-like metal-dependent hydrolase (beta-lactamase superfamily II)